MSKQHLLIVDDDKQICDLLLDLLHQHGYDVSVANNDQQFKEKFQHKTIDLVILDIMMPGKDGLELCRHIRLESDVPIIFLTAMDSDTDKVVGLELGADDYLAKPFSTRELLARVKALLRRSGGHLVNTQTASTHRLAPLASITFLGWVIDQNKRRLVSPDGVTTPLSSGEYELLLAFVEHTQRTLSREQLLDLTRGREASPFDRTIDVQVGRLRKKIEVDPKNPSIIVTVRGGGYMFTPDVETIP